MLIKQVHLSNALFARIGTFLDKDFKFQSTVSDDCHDILIMFVDINSIATSNIHGVDYCSLFFGINKSEAINYFKNTDFSKKGESLREIFSSNYKNEY